MSYPCHYTNLCPHKPHKYAHTHTHTHSHTHTHTHTHTHDVTRPCVSSSVWQSVKLYTADERLTTRMLTVLLMTVFGLCPGGLKWKPFGCCTQTYSTELLLSIFLREHLFPESVVKALYLKFVSCRLCKKASIGWLVALKRFGKCYVSQK